MRWVSGHRCHFEQMLAETARRGAIGKDNSVGGRLETQSIPAAGLASSPRSEWMRSKESPIPSHLPVPIQTPSHRLIEPKGPSSRSERSEYTSFNDVSDLSQDEFFK